MIAQLALSTEEDKRAPETVAKIEPRASPVWEANRERVLALDLGSLTAKDSIQASDTLIAVLQYSWLWLHIVSPF